MDLMVDVCVWVFVLLGFGTLVESFVALCISRVAADAAREADAAAAAAAHNVGSSSSESESSGDDDDDDDDDRRARKRRAVEWTHDDLFFFYESLNKRNVPLLQKQKQRARLEELLDDLNGETHWWRLIRNDDGDETAAHLPLRTRDQLYDWGVLSMETLARLIVLDVFLLEHEPSLLAKERYLNDVFMPSLFKFKNVLVLHGHVQQMRRRHRPPSSPPPSSPLSSSPSPS